MQDEFDSPRDEVLELLSNAVAGAVAKLQLAADGAPVFCSDRQLRACVALARLASLLFANREEIEQRPSVISPLVPPEEAAELLRRLKERTRRYAEESSSNLNRLGANHDDAREAAAFGDAQTSPRSCVPPGRIVSAS